MAITAHPLFPAIVALWFAALFGLGSLAIRPSLIEGIVVAVGLDALVPAAAPPLGVTARMLIAVGMGVLGAVIGAVLARRLARPVAPRKAAPRRAAHPSPAPVAEPEAEARPARRFGFGSGSEVEAAPAAPVLSGRRRALALEDDGGRDFDDAVPLPGGASPQILDITAFALDDEVEDDRDGVPVAAWHTDRPLSPFGDPSAPPSVRAEKPVAEVAEAEVPAAVVRARAEPLPSAPAEASAPADPLPPRRGGVFALVDTATPLFAETASPAREKRARFAVPTGSAAERIVGADLEALSHVELIERLAISLQRRRDAAAAAATAVSEPAQVAAPVAPLIRGQQFAPAQPAGAAEPAPTVPLAAFGRLSAEPSVEGAPAFAASEPDPAGLAPVAMPAAFRPLVCDATADDDDADILSHVPPRTIAMPSVLTRPEDEDEDDGYASLVDMTVAQTPPRQPLIRIDEPEVPTDAIEPVVIFPGQGARTPPFGPSVTAPSPLGEAPVLRQFDPPGAAGLPQRPAAPGPVNDPGEAERALRSALATLQRMNGAA